MTIKTLASMLILIAVRPAYAQQSIDSTTNFHIIMCSNLILSNATLTNNSQIGFEYAFNKRHSTIITYLLPYNRSDTCDDILDYGIELGYKYRISKEKRKNPLYFKLSILQLKGKIFYSMLETSPSDCIYKRNVSNSSIISLGITKEFCLNNRIYTGFDFLAGSRYSYDHIKSGKIFLNIIGAINLKIKIL